MFFPFGTCSCGRTCRVLDQIHCFDFHKYGNNVHMYNVYRHDVPCRCVFFICISAMKKRFIEVMDFEAEKSRPAEFFGHCKRSLLQ